MSATELLLTDLRHDPVALRADETAFTQGHQYGLDIAQRLAVTARGDLTLILDCLRAALTRHPNPTTPSTRGIVSGLKAAIDYTETRQAGAA